MKNLKYYIPLIVVVSLGFLFWVGLGGKPRHVPSQFINQPAPNFNLQNLHQMQERISNNDLKGKVWLLNVWASWCVACRQEHPVLVDMARAGEVPLYGLNHKDRPSDAKAWLNQHGDPYKLSLVDYDGTTGIDYGVYGVPETFIIDKQGVIRHKVTGPLSYQELSKCVMPVVKHLQQDGSTEMHVMNEVRKQCNL